MTSEWECVHRAAEQGTDKSDTEEGVALAPWGHQVVLSGGNACRVTFPSAFEF